MLIGRSPMSGTGLRGTPTVATAIVVSSWAIGFSFIYSSIPHLNNPYSFLATIYGYRILPLFLSQCAAAFLPCLMLILGLCLLSGMFRSSAFVIGTLLLLSFSFAQITVVARGLDVSCGCFSQHVGRPVDLGSLFLTLSLTLLGILGIVINSNALSTVLARVTK
jgi:hypothetical protein